MECPEGASSELSHNGVREGSMAFRPWVKTSSPSTGDAVGRISVERGASHPLLLS